MSNILKKLEMLQAKPHQIEAQVKSYLGLKNQVSRTLVEGRKEAQEAVEKVKAQTYWTVGRLIESHVLQSKKRGDYGKQVIQRLAQDLKTNQTLLYYALQFARNYKSIPDSDNLSWSHYRTLLPVKDEAKRKGFEEEVEKWGWSSRELESKISLSKKADKVSKKAKSGTFARGQYYHYKIIRAEFVSAPLEIDLGLGNFYRPGKLPKNFYAGDSVKSVRTGDNQFKWIKIPKIDSKDLFFYKADFVAVTPQFKIKLRIDLGFNLFCYPEVSLRYFHDSTETRRVIKDVLKESARTPHSLSVRLYPQFKPELEADIFFNEKCLNLTAVTSATI